VRRERGRSGERERKGREGVKRASKQRKSRRVFVDDGGSGARGCCSDPLQLRNPVASPL